MRLIVVGDERRSAGGVVGPAPAQPGVQHVPGAGGHGQDRVVAAPAGAHHLRAAALGQPVGLHSVASTSTTNASAGLVPIAPAPAARASSSRLTASS